MDFNPDNAIVEEEEYFEFKAEIDEFMNEILDPGLQDFKKQLNTMLQNLQSSFNSVSITKKQFMDIQEKLKRNIRNKNEASKNYEDDRDRLNLMKNEFESLFLKIDDKKFEETEKDKLIKTLNEEIFQLKQKKETENIFSNFKPAELEVFNKLKYEVEDIENKILTKEETKRSQIFLENQITEEKINEERNGEKLNEDLKVLEEEIKKLNVEHQQEMKLKKTLDDNFSLMREKNVKLKSDLLEFQKEEETLSIEQRKLNQILDEELEKKKKKQTDVNEQIKKVNDLKKIIEENKNKKLKQYDETISDLRKLKTKREKDLTEYKKETGKMIEMLKENRAKLNTLNEEVDKLQSDKKKKQDEIELVNKEIFRKRTEFLQVRTDLQSKRKISDEKKRELENLSNEINELDNQNMALESANHRAVNETYGIKKETIELENVRDNIEREKNLYAKQASDANMEYTQAQEKLKNLNEAIIELKNKNSAAETKLKNKKKIFDALKGDSVKFEKKYMEALREIKEIRDDKIRIEGKYNFMKLDLDAKTNDINETEEKLEEFQEAVEKNDMEKEELEKICSDLKESIYKYIENNTNLKKMTSSAETDYQNQKKEYGIVVREKDFLQQQLIQRNTELNSLYGKIKVLQQEFAKMQRQFEEKLREYEELKSARDYLFDEFAKTENIIKNIFDLKVIKIKLEKEVLTSKNKARSLEDESQKKLNIHRWTKLEFSDPEKFELITQINSLQRRLIAKTDEVSNKEDLIEEKEKLYLKLKKIVARQSGFEMEEPLLKYKDDIKRETEKLKMFKEEIKNCKFEIKNYELEIKRLNSEMDALKNRWFLIQRDNNYGSQNLYDNFYYENNDGDDKNDNDNENLNNLDVIENDNALDDDANMDEYQENRNQNMGISNNMDTELFIYSKKNYSA
jgi:chromosome segregation ATPase